MINIILTQKSCILVLRSLWSRKLFWSRFRSSHPDVFLGKGVLKICSKFTGEHNFIEITLRHRCSPVNLLHIFRTPFPKYTSGWLFLLSLLQIRFFSHNVYRKSRLSSKNHCFNIYRNLLSLPFFQSQKVHKFRLIIIG